MIGIRPVWNLETDEIKQFLLKRGVDSLCREAGYVPMITDAQYPDVKLEFSRIIHIDNVACQEWRLTGLNIKRWIVTKSTSETTKQVADEYIPF